MRMRWMTALTVLCLTLPALAQDRPPAERPGRPRGGGPGGPRQGGFPGGMFEQMSQRLAHDLELNDQQQAEYDKIVADFRERLATMPGPSGEAQELMRQLRQARQDGDDAKAQELMQKLRELRGGPMAGMMKDFLDQVDPILDDQQRVKLTQFRERMAQFARGGDQRGNQRGPDMRRIIQELPDKLGLDEQQKAQFDELVAQMREQNAAQREAMRPLIDEMRRAWQEGDQQRAEELRQQMEQQRGQGDTALQSLLTQLEGILRDDQKATFADIRQELAGRAGPSGPPDVRGLFQAAMKLDLDKQQRQALTEIRREAMRKVRALEAGDRAGQAALAQEVKAQIVELLQPEQLKNFERALKDQRPLRGQADRPGREGRPGRQRRAQPSDAPGEPDRPNP